MSLLEQLKSRERPSLDYELPVGDIATAQRVLAAAQQAYRSARQAEGEDAAQAMEAARQAVTKAEAALAACYAHITLTAMPPEEFEALIGLHPPRPGTDDRRYDSTTFPKACFLASAAELSEAEWTAVLRENLSYAECEDLYTLAVAVNERLVNAALPKGSTPIRP